MQLGALAGQQVVVDDLAQQRVAEPVAAALVGDDDVARRSPRAARRAARAASSPLASASSSWSSAAPAAEQPQQLLRGSAEALDAQHQRVAQRRRQRAAPVEPGGQQLLGEQRVALAARVEAVDELGVGRRAEDVAELPRRAPRA